MHNVRIFVASSSEGLDTARDLVSLLRDAGWKATAWNRSVFQSPETYIESLESALDEYGICVALMLPDDTLDLRGVSQAAVRDNVVFELGLFMGRHGRSRTLMVSPRGAVNLPSDLLGVDPIVYEPLGSRDQNETVSALNAVMPRLLRALSEMGGPLLTAQHIQLQPMSQPSAFANPDGHPEVCRRERDGRLEVFMPDGAGRLLHAWERQVNGTWAEWSKFGEHSFPKGVTAFSNGAGGTSVVGVSSEGRVLYRRQVSPIGAWGQWSRFTGVVGRQAPSHVVGLTVAGACSGILQVDGALRQVTEGRGGSVLIRDNHMQPLVASQTWDGHDGRRNVLMIDAGSALMHVKASPDLATWGEVSTVAEQVRTATMCDGEGSLEDILAATAEGHLDLYSLRHTSGDHWALSKRFESQMQWARLLRVDKSERGLVVLGLTSSGQLGIETVDASGRSLSSEQLVTGLSFASQTPGRIGDVLVVDRGGTVSHVLWQQVAG